MPTNGKVGFGLLGAGLIAPFHANSIKASDGCELIAVADLDPARVKKVTDKFGCEGRRSLDELLDDGRIDVICVLTPNHLHRDATVKATAAGKHVLVEKPPAMSLKETDEMIAAARSAGTHLGIVLQCRVRKPILAMKEAIASGRFGRLLSADAYMKWFRSTEYYLSDAWRSSRRSGAGVTIQHAFHYIDLLQFLMGPGAAVQARMTNLMHPQVNLEDTLNAFVNFANGAQGVVVASTALWPGTDVRIEINGENGTAIMTGERMTTWKFRDEQPGDEAVRQLGRGSVGTAAGGPADFDFADHQVVISQMARCVRGEQSEPIIPAASARASLEIALGMYKSAATGQPVRLPVTDEESIWKD
ncbi:MAG: Inositol 2-dehydrogenase/D-chiro-inositol 3-dehydrogenase [Phycisphaerae bacterium]|nr:Inositol 2-dehydrogenase/D-chiro-inositol 3-dehydrogenase [Phycisphaerae bacterium]